MAGYATAVFRGSGVTVLGFLFETNVIRSHLSVQLTVCHKMSQFGRKDMSLTNTMIAIRLRFRG